MDTLRIDAQRGYGWGLLALAALLAGLTVLSDPAGRLLTGPAAVVALVLAVRDLRRGAVLVADAAGVAARTGFRHVRAGWDEVERMRVVRDRRAELLELDLGRTVVLLSRTRLGRFPADVLADLQAVRAAGVDALPPPTRPPR